MSDGVIGNTSDSGSEESRFEPWSDNLKKSLAFAGLFHFYPKFTKSAIKSFLFFVSQILKIGAWMALGIKVINRLIFM